MRSNVFSAVADAIFDGGTISGDVTINGDLTVNGDGSGNYDEIVNGNLAISSTNKLVLGGDGSDTYIQESGADVLDIYVGGANMMKFTESTTDTVLITGNLTVGVDDTGNDVRIYSATTNEGLLYDASEDELGLLLTTKLKFHDIGGGEEIYASANGHLEINAGSTVDITAPTIDMNASTAVTFGGSTVSGPAVQVLSFSNSSAVDRTLSAAESGALISIDPSVDNTNTIKITLPTMAAGLNYRFIVTADATNTAADILFTSASASNDFRGHILSSEGGVEVVANACAFTIDVSAGAGLAIGTTSWEVVGDGTYWILRGFYTGNDASIGISGDGLLLTNSTL